MGSDSACMQINGIGKGYPHPRKESPLNQGTKAKGSSRKNFKLPTDAPVNMIDGMVAQLSEVMAKQKVKCWTSRRNGHVMRCKKILYTQFSKKGTHCRSRRWPLLNKINRTSLTFAILLLSEFNQQLISN